MRKNTLEIILKQRNSRIFIVTFNKKEKKQELCDQLQLSRRKHEFYQRRSFKLTHPRMHSLSRPYPNHGTLPLV